MKNVTSDVLQFRGTHYDFGFWQGERLKETALLSNRTALHQRLAQRFVVDIDVIEQLFKQFAPALLAEIQGLADSLQLDLQTAYLYFAGYYGNRKSGCSIMMGSNYMIRNYDNAPDTYDGRYVLYAPSDTGFATIGPTMQVTGRMDGMNEHGLVVGYNFVNTRGGEDGFVCNMITRIVLETCATVEEAYALLQALPHKHSFNYCLLDQTGRALAVEASPRNVIARETFACTNHFHLQNDENRYRMDDSLARERIITNAQPENVSFQHAFQLLNDTAGGVFATKYGAWDGTLHTAGYVPNNLLATIALGGDATPMPIHFNKWLNGEPLLITRLKGKIDASSEFANR